MINNNSDYGRDRLSEKFDQNAKAILEQNIFAELDDLKFLSEINIAHVTMLEQCKIISSSASGKILIAAQEIAAENFAGVHKLNDCSIGYYFAYEQYLSDKIGPDLAGLIHIGRSRNDINATIQRLKSKYIYEELKNVIRDLRVDILVVAEKNIAIAMPIYSQYQPAMPATYAYYLIAIENALAVIQEQLQSCAKLANTATLGASSGAGTTYPIDPSITAELLGFKYNMPNALTVVATRDLELMLLSIGANLGVTISRVAQDYHLWTTKEFALFALPDRLCGISSAMPQKKNPYLLEKIKGKAIRISGVLAAAHSSMHKTPFASSVEVGTEALVGYIEGFAELIKAIKLLSSIITGAEPIEKNMQRSNTEGLTVATNIAEHLARDTNISCREAHSRVGEVIAMAMRDNQDPLQAILALVDNFNVEPDTWHKKLEYGNGSGIQSTKEMLELAKKSLAK